MRKSPGFCTFNIEIPTKESQITETLDHRKLYGKFNPMKREIQSKISRSVTLCLHLKVKVKGKNCSKIRKTA